MNRPSPSTALVKRSRRNAIVVGGVAVAAAVVGGAVYFNDRAATVRANRAELVRGHAPTLGDATARVHVVEFLDPACETCAAFYPIVHELLQRHEGRVRLSLRHVPLHANVAPVVAMLEAARAQDRYWPALEALLADQNRWVVRHVAQPATARSVLARAGVDLARLDADLNAPEVAQRMAQDRADAQALGVEKTPEYFVNGRQMASFGRSQLVGLIEEEIRNAY